MSHAATRWVYDVTDVHPMAKFVLFVLADYADDEGRCWPSQAALAARTSMGERTVRRHLQSLEELGLIAREQRRDAAGGHRLTDVITLQLTTGQTGRLHENEQVATTGQPGRLEGEPQVSTTGQVGRVAVDNPDLPAKLDRPTGQTGRVTTTEPSDITGVTVGNPSTRVGAREAPPENLNRCRDHAHSAAPPPCRACADVRKANAREAARLATEEVRARHAAEAAERQARIDECDRCDDEGYVRLRATAPKFRCNHQGRRPETICPDRGTAESR